LPEDYPALLGVLENLATSADLQAAPES
jgi:hypothetical protein